MTRRGLLQASVVGALPPATDPRVHMVTVASERLTPSNVQGRLKAAEAQRSGLSASTSVLPSAGRAIPDISRSSKSP